MKSKTTWVVALVLLVFAQSSLGASPAAVEGSIAVLTYLHLKPATFEQFQTELVKIIAPSRAEPGNLAWYVQQSKDDPTQVVFYTRWVNQAALDWHLQSKPLTEYIQRTAPLLAEPAKLVKFHPLDLGECDQCECCP